MFSTRIYLDDARRLDLEWTIAEVEVNDEHGVVWHARATCRLWRYARMQSGDELATEALSDPWIAEVSANRIELVARALMLGAISHALTADKTKH